MIKGQLSDRLSNLGVLGVLSANPFRAEESTRAKLAKDAKLKAIKHDEIAPVVVESVYEVLLGEEG